VRGCAHSCAIEDALIGGDSRRLRVFALALGIAISRYPGFDHRRFSSTPTQTSYASAALPVVSILIGSVMFGIGMALVGTCGFGSLVRPRRRRPAQPGCRAGAGCRPPYATLRGHPCWFSHRGAGARVDHDAGRHQLGSRIAPRSHAIGLDVRCRNSPRWPARAYAGWRSEIGRLWARRPQLLSAGIMLGLARHLRAGR